MAKTARTAFLLGFCLLSHFRLSAAPLVSSHQESDKGEKTSGLTFLPVILYTPETKWALGGGGMYYFRLTRDKTVRRPSNISFNGAYTQRKQTDLNINPDFYLKSGLHLQVKFQYSDFPDQFYGIGNGTAEEMEEPFTSKFWKMSVEALKRVRGPLNAGLQYLDAAGGEQPAVRQIGRAHV